MSTLLVSHASALAHGTPPGHPEQVARYSAIMEALSAPAFDALARAEAPEATDDLVARVHPQSYIDAIRQAAPKEGRVALDADTHMAPGTLEAALRAVGGACLAVDRVVAGDNANAFLAMRPPGHHAERQTPMGFCLFGTVAAAAKHALDAHGLSKVAILDFDVHHGNGTQDLLWDEPRVRFVSCHQMPLYPGSGHPQEQGAHGQVRNIPLAPGDGGAVFRRKMEAEALPFLEAFGPELVLISAGFDAHAADPLANLELAEEDFAWITGKLCDLAEAHAGGRVVSVLEGGYDLAALAASAAAHVQVLMARGAS